MVRAVALFNCSRVAEPLSHHMGCSILCDYATGKPDSLRPWGDRIEVGFLAWEKPGPRRAQRKAGAFGRRPGRRKIKRCAEGWWGKLSGLATSHLRSITGFETKQLPNLVQTD